MMNSGILLIFQTC